MVYRIGWVLLAKGSKSNARPHLVLLILGLLSLISVCSVAAESRILIKSVRVENEIGRGIPAELRAVGVDDRDIHFAYTDEVGVANPNKHCSANTRLTAKPRVTGVYEVPERPPYCKDGLKIVLRLTRIKSYLKFKADAAFRSGDFAAATLLYTESANRYQSQNPEQARQAEAKAYESLSMAIGGRVRFLTFDDMKGRPVVTREGKDYLLGLQKAKDIPTTGKLDLSTAEAIAGRPVKMYIIEAYEYADGLK